MKHAIAVALAALLTVSCAAAQQTPPAEAAKPACKPPPKDLVTKDLEIGKGRTVEMRVPIYVNYTGWLYDGCAKDFKGAQFDTSAGRATPFGFIAGVGPVIKGWNEGVIGMKEHGKRLLVIPPDKAYGERGSPDGRIPPHATLVFEIEVIQFVLPGTNVVPKKPQ